MSGGAAAACPSNYTASAAVHGGLQTNGCHHHHQMSTTAKAKEAAAAACNGFQMPLHYPRYKKSDYEKMAEWQIDCLLREYGLPVGGDIHQKRKFAIGAFLWPDQLN